MSTDSFNQSIQDISNDLNQNINKKIKYNKPNKSLDSIINHIFHKFTRKYNHMQDYYEYTIIDNIIYNDKSRIVSTFKDLLIINDWNEYLKRFYKFEEILIRIPKYCEYYNLYSKIFPNYTSILEGKYLYLNIQKKQRMIDLQEQMEHDKLKKERNKNQSDEESKEDINVFSTSIVNSTLNRINKEEMEILFDINYDNINKDDIIFADNLNKLINLINSYEVKKEEYLIEYNYEDNKNKNKNKLKKTEDKSPLMNININYINFNKVNDDKSNTVSVNKKSNKNNIFLYRIINNMPMKDNKNNNITTKQDLSKNKLTSLDKKDYNLFIMKINQIRKNKKLFHNKSIHIKNKYLSNQRSNSFIYNKSYNSKLNSKNGTIAYESRNKSSSNNPIKNNNKNIKKLFSCKSSFFVLPKDVNKIDGLQKNVISPFNSRNQLMSDSNNNNIANNKFFSTGKNMINSTKDNKSIFAPHFFKLMNSNSRNKIFLSKIQSNSNMNSSQKFKAFQKSLSPSNSKFSIRQKKKIKKNNSFFNETVFNKKKIISNYAEKINSKSNLKEKIIFNRINENINNRNSSLLSKKLSCEFYNSSRLHHSHSTKVIKKRDSRNVYNKNKKNIKTVFISRFLKAFNNTNVKIPFTQRNNPK